MKIQTEALCLSVDAKLVSSIEQKVSKLDQFFSRISEVRVILKFDNTVLTKERIAEIKIHVPNGVIFIKESSKTFDLAFDKALVALKVQLLRYKAKRLSYGFV
jgi:putative sigma-54 modulation protein